MGCGKLSDDQRGQVRAGIPARGGVGPALGGALEAVDFARWDVLPDAPLPWDRVTDLAAAQGISEADVVWHLAAGLNAKAAAKRK